MRVGERDDAENDWLARAMALNQRRLLAVAWGILGHDDALAADVVQETFVRLWRAKPEGDDGRIAGWLTITCRNVALDLARRLGRIERSEALADAPRGVTDPGRKLEVRHGLESFYAAFEALPRLQRQALELRLVHGLTYGEIGARMGKTASHVGWLLHEGLKRVRAACPWMEGLEAEVDR